MKKNINLIYILFALLIAFVFVLVLPSGVYQLNELNQPIAGTYQEVVNSENEVKELLLAPINGLIGSVNEVTGKIGINSGGKISGTLYISILLLAIGFFMQVVVKQKVIETFFKRFMPSFFDKPQKMNLVLVVFFGFCATTHGMYETIIPLSLAIVLLYQQLGYSPIIPIKLMVLATASGYIGSTINPFATGLASNLVGITVADGFLIRLSMFCLLMFVLIKELNSDLKKYKKAINEVTNVNPTQANTTNSSKIIFEFCLFILPILIMTIGFFPFANFGINWLSISMNQISGIFVLTSLVLIIMNKSSFQTVLQMIKVTFLQMLPICLGLSIARGIYVLLYNTQTVDVLVNYLEQSLNNQGLLVITIMLICVFIISGIFIPSSSAIALIFMPILGKTMILLNYELTNLVTIYQISIGVLKMIAPTSVVLLTILQMYKIEYRYWLKEIRPFLFKAMIIITVALMLDLYI